MTSYICTLYIKGMNYEGVGSSSLISQYNNPLSEMIPIDLLVRYWYLSHRRTANALTDCLQVIKLEYSLKLKIKRND